MPRMRYLEAGEIIQEGDLVDTQPNGWKDEPRWEWATNIGQPAPDPAYPAHRRYCRPNNSKEINNEET